MVGCRLKELLAAQPLPHDGVVGSETCYVEACSERDVVVRGGSVSRLLVLDGEGGDAAEISVDVERDAQLSVLHVVTRPGAVNIAVAMAEGASCRMTQIVVAGSDVRVVASLMGRGARFDFGGAFVLTGEDAGSVVVDVNHMVADCSSRSAVKGVASGNAHGSFAGLVYVAPDAQHTDSEQSSRNITLGNGHIETLPQLEIYADDVKCSHGATVGQMDSEAIMYMRQRGLSLAVAKRLQIEGFVDDVVLHTAVEGSEELLMELLAEKLNKL